MCVNPLGMGTLVDWVVCPELEVEDWSPMRTNRFSKKHRSASQPSVIFAVCKTSIRNPSQRKHCISSSISCLGDDRKEGSKVTGVGSHIIIKLLYPSLPQKGHRRYSSLWNEPPRSGDIS